MNKSLLILVLVSITHTVASGQQRTKFELTGHVSGFADSTVLYLEGFDSTFIVDNQFYFTGTLNEKVKNGVYYYPANYLIDSKGVIIAKDLRGEALRSKLLEILK